MEAFLKKLLLAFIPIFVAVDVIGVLPIFVSLTQGTPRSEKRRIIIQSMITAFCLAISFIFLGKAIFSFLGITVGDFMVAGGAILFAISIRDIMRTEARQLESGEQMGVVPLGTPLIAGPAVLTTSLLLVEEYGVIPTLISVTANLLIAGFALNLSGLLSRFLGEAGTKALSKIMHLLLAAIAVMMIRKGLAQVLQP